jgi:hypothetical protein
LLVLDAVADLIKSAVGIFVPSHVLGIALARIHPPGRCRHPCCAKPLVPVVMYGQDSKGFVDNGDLATGCNRLPNLVTVGLHFFASYVVGNHQPIIEEPK